MLRVLGLPQNQLAALQQVLAAHPELVVKDHPALKARVPEFVIAADRKSGATLERAAAKIGRNDPCPCKSGKKYKKCCLV